MKINTIFKSKYFLYAVGGIVIFAIFYRLASGGSSANSGGLTVMSGAAPSDAQNAAQLQTTLAQLSASTNLQGLQVQSQRDILLATLESENKADEIAAYTDLQKYVTSAESGVAQLTLQTQLEMAREQADFGIATANVAAQTQIGLREIDAAQFMAQLSSNAFMFDSQLKANAQMFDTQIKANVIDTLANTQDRKKVHLLLGSDPKKGIIGANITDILAGNGVKTTIVNKNSGGGFNPLGVVSPIAGIFG